MTIIDTNRDDIRALKGIHLFHFATSNCSQRVRFVLEEKGVAWVSHHVDLIKCENATPKFIALNPNGVVPVMVHDGKTIIESNDIIQYIDQHFEGPNLNPESHQDKKYLEESLKRSSDYQASLKLLTHEFLYKPFRRMNERQLREYTEGIQNPGLSSFLREFSSKEGFGRERIGAAINETEDILKLLEVRLESHNWLTGNEFGLVDISWIVHIHRLSQFHYPLASFPVVNNWLLRMRTRQAFTRAITRFEPTRMKVILDIYSLIRSLRRSSVRHFVPAR